MYDDDSTALVVFHFADVYSHLGVVVGTDRHVLRLMLRIYWMNR